MLALLVVEHAWWPGNSHRVQDEITAWKFVSCSVYRTGCFLLICLKCPNPRSKLGSAAVGFILQLIRCSTFQGSELFYKFGKSVDLIHTLPTRHIYSTIGVQNFACMQHGALGTHLIESHSVGVVREYCGLESTEYWTALCPSKVLDQCC